MKQVSNSVLTHIFEDLCNFLVYLTMKPNVTFSTLKAPQVRLVEIEKGKIRITKLCWHA